MMRGVIDNISIPTKESSNSQTRSILMGEPPGQKKKFHSYLRLACSYCTRSGNSNSEFVFYIFLCFVSRCEKRRRLVLRMRNWHGTRLLPREEDLREAFPIHESIPMIICLKSIFKFSVNSWAILRALTDCSVRVTWCRSLDPKEIKITLTAWRETTVY